MKWTDRKNKGQALLEFTLVAGILILPLMVGIAEWSRYMLARNLLTGAAREAVRSVVVSPGDETTARNRGLAVLAPVITTATITFDPPITESDNSVTRRANATYVYQPVVFNFIPGLPDNITLTSTTSMRQEF
jgi:Flp pilus assembly protein TadG